MADPGQPRRQQTADVVLYWMQRRGMTRQVFADRLGKSVSWPSGAIVKLARAVGVPV